MQASASPSSKISLPPSGRWCPENAWLTVCRRTLSSTPGFSDGLRSRSSVIAEVSAARRAEDRAVLEESLTRGGGDPTWPDPLHNLRCFKPSDRTQGLIVARRPRKDPCGYSHVIRGLTRAGKRWVYEIHLAMIWVCPKFRGRGVAASMGRGILWQLERDLIEIMASAPDGERRMVLPMLTAHPVTYAGMRFLESLNDGAEWIVRRIREAARDGDLPNARLDKLNLQIL